MMLLQRVSVMINALIFDLDGTLLDTIDDLADAGNEFLRIHGFAQHPSGAYKKFIGNGVERLLRAVLPEPVDDEKMLSSYVSEYKNIYRKNYLNKTKPYDGILQMLDEFAGMGIAMAVLSNKPDDMTQDLVKHYFNKYSFVHVQGARPNEAYKPDPRLAASIAMKLDCAAEEVCCIGDSDVDMRMAKLSGMCGIGVLWGFRGREELEQNGAVYIVEYPSQIIQIIKDMNVSS
jgi:phosphoglycolate phosphatase